jgi:PHD/YefM family antitoxin component YafN of YafNO toxin-antitoxin module
MELILQTDTISGLKNNQSVVLAKMRKRPVLLLQNSKPLAVLVSPDEWNRTALRLRELERQEVIRHRVQEARATTQADLSVDEFMADLEETA